MTWLMSLTIVILLVQMALLGWALVYLVQASALLRGIQASLDVWARPASLVEPLQDPGTSWATTDAEIAAQERKLAAESRQRALVGSPKSKRSSPRRTA